MKNNFFYEIIVIAALVVIIFSIQQLTESIRYLELKIDERINQETTRIN